MNAEKIVLWAKTLSDNRPGISVRDHCLNVGCVSEALIAVLLPAVRGLIPQGAATLAALHDVGKSTIGFPANCPQWLPRERRPQFSPGEPPLSVTDPPLLH